MDRPDESSSLLSLNAVSCCYTLNTFTQCTTDSRASFCCLQIEVERVQFCGSWLSLPQGSSHHKQRNVAVGAAQRLALHLLAAAVAALVLAPAAGSTPQLQQCEYFLHPV